jgi:DNA-binding NarL/FixJ family response regulator
VVPDQVLVYVAATDLVSRAVLWSHIRTHPALATVDDPTEAEVVVAVTDSVDDNVLRSLEVVERSENARVVLVVTTLDADGAYAALRAGVRGILHRADADSARLAAAVVWAAGGDVALPSDVMSSLLERQEHTNGATPSAAELGSRPQKGVVASALHPPARMSAVGGPKVAGSRAGSPDRWARGRLRDRDADATRREIGFTERELRILRLVAQGLDTTEIAAELAYSERTVKNAIHAVTERYNLRNRSHAVAYAIRVGVI